MKELRACVLHGLLLPVCLAAMWGLGAIADAGAQSIQV